MNISKLIKEHHQAMIDKGFYDCPECTKKHTTDIDGDKNKPVTFVNPDCKLCKGSFINPNKNIGELLMLIVSELSESLEAHRNNRFAFKTLPNFNIDSLMETHKTTDIMYLFKGHVKDTFEDEIADVFLRLFDLCGYLGIKPVLPSIVLIPGTKNIAERLLFITMVIVDTNYSDLSMLSMISDSIQLLQNLCSELNIPIEKHIAAKMAYNKTRPHKHNKEY